MSQYIGIILVATIIGFGYILLIRNQDIYEKEPLIKLVGISLFGGFISVFTSLLLYNFTTVNHTFADAIFKVGPIEESSKLIALLIIYPRIRKELNEIVDGIVYIAAIALGFSVIENIFYSISSDMPYYLMIRRSMTATIGHISFSGYLGLAFYIHHKINSNWYGIAVAVFIASMAHGLYDAVLFEKSLNGLFYFVFLAIIISQLMLFRLVLGFSAHRKLFSEQLFLPIQKNYSQSCPNCKSQINNNILEFWKIHSVVCPSCNRMVFSKKQGKLLFRYFRPAQSFKSYSRKLRRKGEDSFLDENQDITYHYHEHKISAQPWQLGYWLAENNREDRNKILKIPVLGALLLALGIRYILSNKITFDITPNS